MKKFALLFLLHAAFCLPPAGAVDFPLSKYGQIQNAQGYSSNPYFNPSSPYNQRMPVPIYAQGTELNAGDCRAIADSVVAQQCAQRNNCAGMKLSDIRPAIVIQLSNLQGRNYVSSCIGYVDSAFEAYMNNSALLPEGGFPTAFPAGTGTTAAKPSSKLVLENPFKVPDPPQWLEDRIDRQAELRELQRQNGAEDVELVATKMPATYADLSFTERMANEKAGFDVWKNAKAYHTINIETDEDMLKRKADAATAKAEILKKEGELKNALHDADLKTWCKIHPIECEGEHDVYKDNICKNEATRLAKGEKIKYKDKFEDNEERTLTKDDCMKLSAFATILAEQKRLAEAKKAAEAAARIAKLEKMKTDEPAKWCAEIGPTLCDQAIEEGKIKACNDCYFNKPDDYDNDKCTYSNPYKLGDDGNNTSMPLTKRYCDVVLSEAAKGIRDAEEAKKKEDEEKLKSCIGKLKLLRWTGNTENLKLEECEKELDNQSTQDALNRQNAECSKIMIEGTKIPATMVYGFNGTGVRKAPSCSSMESKLQTTATTNLDFVKKCLNEKFTITLDVGYNGITVRWVGSIQLSGSTCVCNHNGNNKWECS
jgi:hypothetical protein